MNTEQPLVSVVIPTRNRPDLVKRAVRSALDQTYTNIEVVVVIDGPDPATVSGLQEMHEPRLTIVPLAQNVGGSEARNIGVRAGTGAWIAFLDDDDEWRREKIAAQLAVAHQSNPPANFVACRWENRSVDSSTILPRTFPRSEEDWSEYVYCSGQSLPTSTYLASRELMLALPFTTGLPYNQDIDWFLRASKSKKLSVAWVDEPLTIYHANETIVRTSKRHSWEIPYEWAVKSRKILLSRKAFAYCILVACVPRARASQQPLRDQVFLLRKAISLGEVGPRFMCRFLLYSVCGMGSKARLKRALKQKTTKYLKPFRSATA